MALNTQQSKALDLFKQKKCIFITGPGGCGKSFLISHIKDYCEQQGINIAVTALTGCAASLIGGQTIHGWGGIGLGKEPAQTIVSKLHTRPDCLRRWKTTQALIIDEVSMMSAELFNKLHIIAQLVRKSEQFFGGIQLVLCGDFAQLEPIGSDKLCFESTLWREVTPVYLTEIIRQTDPVFQGLLQRLRMGVLTSGDKEVLNSRLMVDESDADIIVRDDQEKQVGVIKATLLYPLKKDVNLVNNMELDKLLQAGAKSRTYHAHDTVVSRVTKQPQHLRPAHTEQLNKCTNAPESLVLAVGAQVMLTKNKSLEDGLVNGSRGVILEINEIGFPVVMFDNGHQLTVTAEDFQVESSDQILIRSQVPLILAWALTIHKCQGATLTNVITDLSEVFGNAQTYVTLSRVRSLDGLFIINIDYSRIRCNPKVKEYYSKLQLK